MGIKTVCDNCMHYNNEARLNKTIDKPMVPGFQACPIPLF